MSHAIEPHLRKLGLITSLVVGEVKLMENYVLCEENKHINVEQSKILVKILYLEIVKNIVRNIPFKYGESLEKERDI